MVANPYETDRVLGEYLLFHYGKAEEVLPYSFGPTGALDFAVRAVTDCVESARLPAGARALDLGCAVGRSTFELARNCSEVIGIDFSQSFIRAAETLRTDGRVTYVRTEEGSIVSPCEALAPANVDRNRARFEVGDACDLRPGLGTFDVVLLINLVDRLPDPLSCLQRLPGLCNSGGQLVIASPFTWLDEYTPRANWLGGFQRDGHDVRGIDALRTILEPDFEFVRAVDLPFLLREHARKFQWSVSLAGIWRRR